jgi:hypothetical protein
MFGVFGKDSPLAGTELEDANVDIDIDLSDDVLWNAHLHMAIENYCHDMPLCTVHALLVTASRALRKGAVLDELLNAMRMVGDGK